ncbi:hypothetical protein FACS189487_05070 [Campylobacterota bacterium]|nr:hypothetical protein FACS189487_05070 [Campylobacterota bacterium]
MKKYLLLFICVTCAAFAADDIVSDLSPRDVALIDRTEMAQIDEKVLAIKEADRADTPVFRNAFYYPPRQLLGDDNATLAVAPKPTEPTLESIIGSKALMNGTWKKEGDTTIGNWKLQKVTTTMVILAKGNSRRTLSMKGDGVKKQNFINKVGG